MKKHNKMNITLTLIIAAFLLIACNASTANMSSLKTSSDADGKTEKTSFKGGETIYGQAVIANNPGKVTVKLSLVDSKGEALKGSDVSVNLESDGVAKYNLPLPEDFPAGIYKLNADMLNEAGEKKDSKSVNITIAE